jgi:DNA-binding GntR family transcriptional regulator
MVTLRSLSAQLSLGEMPVREALRRLTAEGAFEALPNRSARIPSLNRRQVEQILELRVLLEGRAAALAARNISLGQIESLRALLQEMAQGIERGDARAHAARNMAFHFEIYRIADNPVLSALIETLWLRLAPLLDSTVQLLTSKPALFRRVGCGHHERLLTAFQARDPVGADEAMRLGILAPNKIPGYWEGLSLPPG